MINCAGSCIYQRDGVCSLETVAPPGENGGDCIHYVPTAVVQNANPEIKT